MSILSDSRGALVAALVSVGAVACGDGSNGSLSSASTPAPPASYQLGHPADPARLALLDIDVDTAGVGLPDGSGTHATGAVVFAQKCAGCHGPKGEGMAGPPAMPKLVGRDPRDGFQFGNDLKLVKTVGNYWPYSTTIFDYVRRTMPITAPGTLKPDEIYSVVAWLLAENEIIKPDAEMNAKTLPGVHMPARDKFVVDNRTGGKVFR